MSMIREAPSSPSEAGGGSDHALKEAVAYIEKVAMLARYVASRVGPMVSYDMHVYLAVEALKHADR